MKPVLCTAKWILGEGVSRRELEGFVRRRELKVVRVPGSKWRYFRVVDVERIVGEKRGPGERDRRTVGP